MPKLVYIDKYRLRGESFYWQNSERYGISKDALATIGIKDGRLQVDKKIIPELLAVNEDLKKFDFELLIKDGYRSKNLYDLVYKKCLAKYGKMITDRLMNIKDMPHATGKTVDVGLFDPKTNTEAVTRSRNDGPESLLFDYYRNKSDEESKEYQRRQDLLKELMLKNGFEVGTKGEFFHFNYKKQPRERPLA